jgi:hypothetical protein
MSQLKKIKQNCGPLNIWQVEKLMHPYMPFVMKGKHSSKLYPAEKAHPKGFWYQLDIRGGYAPTNKQNSTMEVVRSTLSLYGG